jgi:CDGSH-type Zn-finger protein
MTESEAPSGPVTVTVRPNGPYVIEGRIVVRTVDGTVLEPPPAKVPGIIKLCACGHSQTKPFCDGSHKQPPPSPKP